MICPSTTSNRMPPIRCCIMVPMKPSIAIPVVIRVDLAVSIHCPAFLPKGERSTANAAMCIQANGNEIVVLPNGTLTKMLVSGFKRKTRSKATFKITAGTHLRLTRNPNAIAFTIAGRKSKNRNDTGRPNAIAKKVPRIILAPPT